ncbi:hypothetical protein TNCV_3591701 [Trichonephila clavipes]|nr:hypothetical protein TNCV_3591701 [Trichonephila clavipes]
MHLFTFRLSRPQGEAPHSLRNTELDEREEFCLIRLSQHPTHFLRGQDPCYTGNTSVPAEHAPYRDTPARPFRVRERCTLNLSRAQHLPVGVVVRRGGASPGVGLVT